MIDVAVVGGGPAGLAVAIETARRGLSVVVLERNHEPPDKACGEGIMPPGLRVLERLGIRERLSPSACAPFQGVRYVDQDGSSAQGTLPGGGLAVRRVALVRAMSEAAEDAGAEIHYGCRVVSHRRSRDEVRLETDLGTLSARMLVAADGLNSRLRRAEGLDARCAGPRRFGLRRHFSCPPWSSSIEVHFAPAAEAYVTPVSDGNVGVAFLWTEPLPARGRSSDAPADPCTRWQRLAAEFPRLMDRLRDAAPDSAIRGAGPFERRSGSCVADRFALVGDAAGYVDAITGEGISLSLLSASALACTLPAALARGAHRATLMPYEREFRRLFRRYEIVTRSLLAVVRRPVIRSSIIRLLRSAPGLFDLVLANVVA